MSDEGAVSFGEALSFLYENRLRDDGKPYSDRDISNALRKSGVDASYSYLWMLRSGKKDHPRTNVVVGLAQFFRVPAGYFLDRAVYDDWRNRLGAEANAAGPEAGASSMLMRNFSGMSSRSQSLLEALAVHVSALEGDDGSAAADD